MSSWRTIAHMFLVCAGIALAPLIPYALRSPWIGWPSFLRSYAAGLVFSLAIGIPAQIWFGRMWVIARRFGTAMRWLVICGFALVLTFAGVAAGCIVLGALGLFHWQDFGTVYLRTARSALVITFVFGGLVAAYEQMRHRLQSATLQLRRKEEERERAVTLAMEARLASLESRVHPHFLFNALNTISALTRVDPKRAEHLVGRLAALLRFSLDATRSGQTTIGEELTVVRDYLEIESARYGERLRFQIDSAVELNSCTIPALSIQTLVENSVKFAVAPNVAGARILVQVTDTGGDLRISVSDGGPGFDAADMLPGHGLEQLETRLAAQYGGRGSLRVTGSTVTVQVPLVRNAVAQ